MTNTPDGPPMEPREALARALYEEINRSREYVPAWDRMPQICREAWSEDADFVLLHLGKSGFEVKEIKR